MEELDSTVLAVSKVIVLILSLVKIFSALTNDLKDTFSEDYFYVPSYIRVRKHGLRDKKKIPEESNYGDFLSGGQN